MASSNFSMLLDCWVRLAHRPRGHEDRIFDLHYHLECFCHGACVGAEYVWFHDRAFGAGPRGIREFPGCDQDRVAEWFPKKERALATGIFNSGCQYRGGCGADHGAIDPGSFGWQMAFIVTGSLGFIWLSSGGSSMRSLHAEKKLGRRSSPISMAMTSRSASRVTRKCPGASCWSPADLGFCFWKIPDRSYLVVLSFLAAGLLQ